MNKSKQINGLMDQLAHRLMSQLWYQLGPPFTTETADGIWRDPEVAPTSHLAAMLWSELKEES